MKKKTAITVGIIAAVAVIAVVAAIFLKGGDSQMASKENVVITVGASQNWVKDIDRELAAEFTEKTGIEIDFQVNPDDQYDKIIKTKLATNEAPDIMYVSAGVSMQTFQPTENFLDLSDMAWVDQMKDWAKEGSIIDGKLYGFNMWSVDGTAMMYNKQMFEEYNLSVPQNFEELKEVCQVLKDNGIIPIYENAKDPWHNHWWLSMLAAAFEKESPGFVERLNKNEAKYADSAVMLQALKDYKELYDLGYFGEEPFANEWEYGYEAMGTGKAGMIATYIAYSNEIQERYPDSNAIEWEMFPLLIGGINEYNHSAGGVVRVVNKQTKYADEIEQYFNFLVEKENAERYYTARTDLGEASVIGVEVREQTPAYTSLVSYSKNGTAIVCGGSVKYWSVDTIGKAMQDMLTGNITPEEAIAEMDAERQKTFEAAGE